MAPKFPRSPGSPSHPPTTRTKTVAFDSGHLTERGTDVALFDYADLNETLLGNHSIICCPAGAAMNCLERFRERFDVVLYRSIATLERALAGVDFYYRMVAGRPDPAWPLPNVVGLETAVHTVFTADVPYGDRYAAISGFVAERHADGSEPPPVVPYVVRLPAPAEIDVRDALGIPRDATVLGRHGGYETFDLPFAQDAVRHAVRTREDLWFVFVNTMPFDDHPRVVFLNAIVDPGKKASFIDACDGMIHARGMGESFGLACAEFAIRGKPIITWFCSRDRFHIDVLRDKGIYYTDRQDLDRILHAFAAREGDFDAYSERFGPETVMRTFEDVFLTSPSSACTA
ncbi:MAG: hypothetical protein KDC95_04600 [Planctomycetes bacterium]|nr:hypothetical protein [Planctomycetota bacterium]